MRSCPPAPPLRCTTHPCMPHPPPPHLPPSIRVLFAPGTAGSGWGRCRWICAASCGSLLWPRRRSGTQRRRSSCVGSSPPSSSTRCQPGSSAPPTLASTRRIRARTRNPPPQPRPKTATTKITIAAWSALTRTRMATSSGSCHVRQMSGWPVHRVDPHLLHVHRFLLRIFFWRVYVLCHVMAACAG